MDITISQKLFVIASFEYSKLYAFIVYIIHTCAVYFIQSLVTSKYIQLYFLYLFETVQLLSCPGVVSQWEGRL